MPTLIDGHNLVPKMGLSLASFDDELQLAERLTDYCRYTRKSGLEIYFDNAPDGYPATRRMGLVTAHFVRRPQIADEAIRQRLKKLGKAAKNWSVVSSDNRVQAEARALGAKTISSDEFAAIVIETLRAGPPVSENKNALAPGEVDEWLRIFSERGKQK
jgi:predicted RNA-binding protein with PIN domain